MLYGHNDGHKRKLKTKTIIFQCHIFDIINYTVLKRLQNYTRLGVCGWTMEMTYFCHMTCSSMNPEVRRWFSAQC